MFVEETQGDDGPQVKVQVGFSSNPESYRSNSMGGRWERGEAAGRGPAATQQLSQSGSLPLAACLPPA